MNCDNFILDFLNIDWATSLYHITDVDEAFETFNTLIQDLINQHVPTVMITKRQLKTLSKPWITPGIVKSLFHSAIFISANILKLQLKPST